MLKLKRLVPFLICVSVFLTTSQTNAQFQTPPRNYGFVVFNSNGVRIDPGRSLLFSFHVAAYLVRARLAGNILAQGGAGDDLRVLVYRDQRVIFDRRERSIVLSIPITEPGEYRLVLNNEFSIVSAKIARGYVNLLYDGVDTQRARIERESMIRRTSLAQGILDQLYVALQHDERELGTFQVPYKPRIFAKLDEELNASSVPQANIIMVNRGTFELAESFPTKERDILAVIIGHELAHIFYKHPRGSTGGIWGELMGVLPIDRAQEREADVLGARLACQAGFDPNGMIVFLQGFIARYGDRTGFGSDHPQSTERIGYIRDEARRCANSSDRRSEPDRPASNSPTGNVEKPSSRYVTYSELGLLRVSIPDNWREFPKGQSVWLAPEGAYGEVNGRSILTHGIAFGSMQAQQQNLRQATENLVNSLIKSNPGSHPRSAYRQTYLDGRNALAITLDGINEATGKSELVEIVATKLHNDALLYVVTVSPADDYRNYISAFTTILRSIKLQD